MKDAPSASFATECDGNILSVRYTDGTVVRLHLSIYSGARKYRNGVGNFVYPGPDGRLLPSLRLENLRDGLEDYEYLCLMRSGIEKLRQQNGDPGLLARAEAVLAVPQSVARAVNDYSSDPSHLLAWRARLADMIEALASMKVSEQ